jgi:hypothetical protein
VVVKMATNEPEAASETIRIIKVVNLLLEPGHCGYLQELIMADVARMRHLRDHAEAHGVRGYSNPVLMMAKEILNAIYGSFIAMEAREVAAVVDSDLLPELTELREFVLRCASYMETGDLGSDLEARAKDIKTRWAIVPIEGLEKECPSCKGSGEVPHPEYATDVINCGICAGTGMIPKCDGNHPVPLCGDNECWLIGPPV